MFLEARCFICECVKLPPHGDFTVGSDYPFEYLIDAEKIVDDSKNRITFPENIFKIFFGNIKEAVTSYDPVLEDRTVYKIYLILHEEIPSIEEIKAYAKITDRNYLQSKKALRSPKNLLVSGNAYDIGEVLKKLRTFQIRYEIEPTYPYENFFKKMIRLYEPRLEDLWFRQKFMSDESTMSYNHAWGGTIPFPESKWPEWYNDWVIHHDNKRFYRYLMKCGSDEFIGEIAYYFDNDRKIWLADIIIDSGYRGRGYGTQGLNLLCKTAAESGIEVLYDDIAIDNPAVSLFLKNGFIEEYRTDEIIMLKKDLRKL